MNQYEYKFIKLDTTNRHADDIELIINQYGEDGWELFDIKEMWSLDDSGFEIKQDFLILRITK